MIENDIVFRVWKPKHGSGVIALWPAVAADFKGNCQSYEHNGQHGGADYSGIIASTRPASPAEYADLLAELTQIGYRPHIIKRASRKHREHREGWTQ